jgi:hypothetical protein
VKPAEPFPALRLVREKPDEERIFIERGRQRGDRFISLGIEQPPRLQAAERMSCRKTREDSVVSGEVTTAVAVITESCFRASLALRAAFAEDL